MLDYSAVFLLQTRPWAGLAKGGECRESSSGGESNCPVVERLNKGCWAYIRGGDPTVQLYQSYCPGPVAGSRNLRNTSHVE
eukprot:9297264-Pyramimonas_sp.AAC.1